MALSRCLGQPSLQTIDLLDLYEYAPYVSMGAPVKDLMNTSKKISGKHRLLECKA